jgi:hypothetical protein
MDGYLGFTPPEPSRSLMPVLKPQIGVHLIQGV